MAYFSNGAEGDEFEEMYCRRCVNWDRDEVSWGMGVPGCAVMDAHLMYQGTGDDAQGVLDTLIDPAGNRCRMFIPVEGVRA